MKLTLSGIKEQKILKAKGDSEEESLNRLNALQKNIDER